MLFAVKYAPRPSRTEEQRRHLRQLFLAWRAPTGLELEAHYHYVSGGGVLIVETPSATSLFEALEPFKPMVEFDVEPVVNMIEAIALSLDVEQWADRVLR